MHVFQAIPGDANGDRIVDTEDYFTLAGNWYKPGPFDWTGADFTGDGFVDTEDYFLLAGHWYWSTEGKVAGRIPPLPAAPVPEPATLLMLVTAALALLPASRRRSRVARMYSSRSA